MWVHTLNKAITTFSLILILVLGPALYIELCHDVRISPQDSNDPDCLRSYCFLCNQSFFISSISIKYLKNYLLFRYRNETYFLQNYSFQILLLFFELAKKVPLGKTWINFLANSRYLVLELNSTLPIFCSTTCTQLNLKLVSWDQ